MFCNAFTYFYRGFHPNIDFLMEYFENINFKVYDPLPDISIDKTLYQFKGRVAFRQRIPSKPHSTGLKYFIMADSAGFIISAKLYKGKLMWAKTTHINFDIFDI